MTVGTRRGSAQHVSNDTAETAVDSNLAVDSSSSDEESDKEPPQKSFRGDSDIQQVASDPEDFAPEDMDNDQEDEEEGSDFEETQPPKKKSSKKAKATSKSTKGRPKSSTACGGRKGMRGFNVNERPAPMADYQPPKPIDSPSAHPAMCTYTFTKNDNQAYRLQVVSGQVEDLQEALASLYEAATEQIDELKSAIMAREEHLADFYQYSHGLFNSYSGLKEDLAQLEVENSKLSITVSSLKALQKTSTNEIALIKQSNSATVSSLKENIKLLKGVISDQKAKLKDVSSTQAAVTDLENYARKKDIDVQTDLRKKKNQQMLKDEERSKKKEEKSARFSLTSQMSNQFPSGSWSDVVTQRNEEELPKPWQRNNMAAATGQANGGFGGGNSTNTAANAQMAQMAQMLSNMAKQMQQSHSFDDGNDCAFNMPNYSFNINRGNLRNRGSNDTIRSNYSDIENYDHDLSSYNNEDQSVTGEKSIGMDEN